MLWLRTDWRRGAVKEGSYLSFDSWCAFFLPPALSSHAWLVWKASQLEWHLETHCCLCASALTEPAS